MNDKKQYRKPAAIEVVHKPQLKPSNTHVHTPECNLTPDGNTVINPGKPTCENFVAATRMALRMSNYAVPPERIKEILSQPSKLSLADRIRNAVGAPTDLSPKAVRAYLHGLKINLRNLANEVEKLESKHDVCVTSCERGLENEKAKNWNHECSGMSCQFVGCENNIKPSEG